MVASRQPFQPEPDNLRPIGGRGANGGDIHVVNARHPGPTKVSAYDFLRPSRFSKDHLRTLQSMHEQLARVLSTSLSSFLRLNVRSQLTIVEQTGFEDYADRIPNPTIVYVLRMSPLEGPMTLELSIDPARIMLDRLCGGPGTLSASHQQPTEIERSLLRPLGRQIARAVGEAWAPVKEVEPFVDDVLLNPRAVRAVTPNDIVALLTFELAVGDIADRMVVCLPFHTLEPIMDQLSARVWNLDQAQPDTNSTEVALRSRLMSAPVTATVILGEVDLTTSSVMSLREGDVLRLGAAAQGELTMTVDGRPLFRCRPGQSSGHVAVQIERIVEPLGVDL